MTYYSKTGFEVPAKEPQWTNDITFRFNSQGKFEYELDNLVYYITESTNASENVKSFWEDVYERYDNGDETRIDVRLECRYEVGMKGDGYLQPDDPDEFDILNYKIDIYPMPDYVSEELEKEIYRSVYAYIAGSGILEDIEEDLYREIRDDYLYGD